jgi:citronellyl-CoA dehydrogenase
MGFTREVNVSRFYRDFRAGSIAGGADEIMLSIIAKTVGMVGKPGKK